MTHEEFLKSIDEEIEKQEQIKKTFIEIESEEVDNILKEYMKEFE